MNEQLTAHFLANRYPQKLIIKAECNHEAKKYKHHEDYSKPFEVELLCRECHGMRRAMNSEKPRNKKVPLTPYGKKIAKSLVDRSLKERELADALGVSIQALSMALHGYRDSDPYREILKRAEGYLKSL